MIRKLILALLLVLLTAGVLAGVKYKQSNTLMSMDFSQPPEVVSSAIAEEKQWQETLSAIGSITSVQGVNVTTEIPGIIVEIAFESGAAVNKSDLLIRLDTTSEAAQLRAIEAQVELSRINAERERNLRKDNLVPQSELDAAEATLKQNVANADNLRTIIEKKTIRAPFSGRLGIRLVNLGQYLEAGKPIASLQSLAPIHADFSLPQQELARLTNGLRVRVTTDAYPARQFDGTLTAINPDLDAATRSVGLQATFDNAEQLLRPGMFARVEVLLPERKSVLSIPATAILSAPYGDSVFVIEPNTRKDAKGNIKAGQVVRQQFVRTGRARGDFLSVESGLKPGEKLASSGVFKLRNGMFINENNDIVPKASETPNPADS
jgi:membrane fusion protein (multidrug efflux system)